MIQKTQAYQTEDGQTFDTIEKAQEHELQGIVGIECGCNAKLVANRDKVLAILTSTGRKPRTRKAAKKTKAATQAA